MPEDNILKGKLRNVRACLSTKKRFKMFAFEGHVRQIINVIVSTKRNFKVEFREVAGPSGEFTMAIITVEKAEEYDV